MYIFILIAVLIVVGLIAKAQFSYYTKSPNTLAPSADDTWRLLVENCDYKYNCDGTGIAVDIPNKKVHLMQIAYTHNQAGQKTYDFGDVREWSYEIPGVSKVMPGRVLGGGFQGACQSLGEELAASRINEKNEKDARAKTGLILLVKDIENPKWFIKCSQEKLLLSWMEILRQSING